MKNIILSILTLCSLLFSESQYSVLVLDKNKEIQKQEFLVNKMSEKVKKLEQSIILLKEIDQFLQTTKPGNKFSLNINDSQFKLYKDQKIKNIVLNKKWYKQLRELNLPTTYRGNDTYADYNRKVYVGKLKKEQDNLTKYRKQLYATQHIIKPFGFDKWHITPYQVLVKLCQDKSISKISFNLTDSGSRGNKANIEKNDVCNNLTINSLSKFITESTHKNNLQYLFKNKYIYKDNKTKYLFDSHYNEICPKKININNLEHSLVYRFYTSKDITSKLLLENEKLLKSFYLNDKSNNKYYGYFGLEYVGIFSTNQGQDKTEIKFNSLSKMLSEKYKNYPIVTRTKMGYTNLDIGKNFPQIKLTIGNYGKFYGLEYDYPLYRQFRGMHKKMLTIKEKKNSKKQDYSNKL